MMEKQPLFGLLGPEYFQVECLEHSHFSLSELLNSAFKKIGVSQLSSDSVLVNDWIDQQLQISLCFILNDSEFNENTTCTVDVKSGAKLVVLNNDSGKVLLTRTITYGFFSDLILKPEVNSFVHERLLWLANSNNNKINKTTLHKYDVIGSTIINDGVSVHSDISLVVGNEVLSIKARGIFGSGESVYLSENHLSELKMV